MRQALVASLLEALEQPVCPVALPCCSTQVRLLPMS
jgi:hypothetical protein